MTDPASETLQAIESFIVSAGRPAILEPGDPPMPLAAGRYAASISGQGRLMVEAWDDTRNLVRRVRHVVRVRPGELELEIERFGRKAGTLLLVDLARPAAIAPERRAARLALSSRLRRFLTRQFAGWTITEVASGTDLEHSLSPAYPRAMVKRGATAWAALAAPEDAMAASHALTFGLLWLHHLRRRERRVTVEGLCLFLPSGKELTACLRLRWMNPHAARYAVFLYDGDWEEPLTDPAAHGNVDTLVQPASGNAGAPPPPRHPSQPEAQLEAMVRANPTLFDPDLLPTPVYGQVPAMAGGDRGLLDLLACGRDGRLAVLELKASEDIHLPLQALDYWLRVGWHLVRGDFRAQGYFPGIAVRHDLAPRLLLIAPALQFHPTTETLLRYFSPAVEVERIGLTVEWQKDPRAMFRLRGARAAG